MTSFFSVIAKQKTWTTAIYMFLGLPLGIAYFTFLVTGVTLGAGLLPLALIGIPILIAVAIGTRAMMRFERELAVGLLGAEIDAVPVMPQPDGNWLLKLKALFTDRTTWSGIVFLLARFPLGIATFTIAITTLAVSGTTATLWIFYRWIDWEIGNWQVDTASEALMFLVPGVFLFCVTAPAELDGQCERLVRNTDAVTAPMSHFVTDLHGEATDRSYVVCSFTELFAGVWCAT